MAARKKAERKKVPASKRKSSTRRKRGLLDDPKRYKKFIETLQESGNVSLACRNVHVTSQTAYRLRAEHPEFREEWDAAIDSRIDQLEDAAMRLAEVGWEENVYQRGELVGRVRKFSPQLILGMLNARRYQRGKGALLAGADEQRTNVPTQGVLRVRGTLDEVAWEAEHGGGNPTSNT